MEKLTKTFQSGEVLKAQDLNNVSSKVNELVDSVNNGGSGSGGSVTVDSSLSTTSVNPVQNKVITAELNKKVNSVSGKQLSTNDFTDDYKNKLDKSIEKGYSLTPSRFYNKSLPSNPTTLRILSFGNSFSDDSMGNLPGLLAAAGITNVVLGKLVASSCSLKLHYENYTSESATYRFDKTDSNVWRTISRTYTAKEALLSEPWDIVTFQQVSGDSGKFDTTFQPYLNNLIDIVRRDCTNAGVIIGYNMTWAYASKYSGLKNYGGNQITMYESILDSVKKVIGLGIDLIIPCGTTLQNLRGTSVNDDNELCRDGMHLEEGAAQYAVACAWFQAIISQCFNTNIIGNTYRISSGVGVPVTDNNANTIQLCAAYACSNRFGISAIPGDSISVTGVSLDKSSIEVGVGGSDTLSATILPSNAPNRTVIWSSSNPSVATVSSNGVITGISIGNTTITATTEDGGYTATCEVVVNNVTVAVTGVSLDKTTLSLQEGDTDILNMSVLPSNATNRSTTWSSSNPAIASVSSDGIVTGVTAGNATITVTTEEGGYTATCEVTVMEQGAIDYDWKQGYWDANKRTLANPDVDDLFRDFWCTRKMNVSEVPIGSIVTVKTYGLRYIKVLNNDVVEFRSDTITAPYTIQSADFSSDGYIAFNIGKANLPVNLDNINPNDYFSITRP